MGGEIIYVLEHIVAFHSVKDLAVMDQRQKKPDVRNTDNLFC